MGKYDPIDPNGTTLHVRLTPDEMDILNAMMGKTGRKKSELIRNALWLYKDKTNTPRFGEWTKPTKINGTEWPYLIHCSVCGSVPVGIDQNTNYCPSCGVVMFKKDICEADVQNHLASRTLAGLQIKEV